MKRPAALTILQPTPEELTKIAAARVESDYSNPGVEGDKVKADIPLFFRFSVFYYFN